MSAISASGVSLPAERCRLLGPGVGVEDTPRWAWPVVAKPSSRAVARVEEPRRSARRPRRRRAAWSRHPRRRTGASASRACGGGSSITSMPAVNSRSPSLSLRKLVLRAIAAPLIALARWPTSEPATRRSNTTGTRLVSTLRGLSRSTVRSPAVRPTFSGESRSAPCRRGGIIVVALHGGALAGDRRHRYALAPN